MAKDPKKEALKKELKTMSVPAPKRTIDYQVDTLQTPESAAAYFSPDRNTITINYFKGEDNSFNESRSTKAHEQKHRDNNAAGMKNMPMSLEQYYKVCCHDEISANICELLEIREAYKAAKTPQARAKIVKDNSKFDYYFEAIKSGEINPLSSKSADFAKEMKFIATETQKMWMECFAGGYDIEVHAEMTQYFFNTHSYDELHPNNANYAKARKIAYTIGGIDFSKYMGDIECINPDIKQADNKIKNNEPRTKVKTKVKPIRDYMDFDNSVLNFKNIDLKPIEGLSMSQQYRLAQHQLFIANVVNQSAMLFDADIMNDVKKGKFTNYDEAIKDAFKHVQEIRKNYPQFQTQWKKAEEQFATQLAGDKATTLFLNLEKENNKKYQEELAKIYTINGINLQQYYKDVEKLIPNNVPENIKAIENSSWYTRLGNKCRKNYNKVVSLFSQDDDLFPQPTEEEKKERKEREEREQGKKALYEDKLYKGKPKYSTWLPEERVSPVLSAEITDFTKPFLKQEQEQKQLADAKTTSAVSNAKLTARVAKKPDAVRAKKAPKKTAAKKQEPSVLDNVIDNVNQGVNMIWTKLKNFTR